MRRIFFPVFFIAIFFLWGFSIWQLVFYKDTSEASSKQLSAIVKPVEEAPTNMQPLPKKVLGIIHSVSPTQEQSSPTPSMSKSEQILRLVNNYRKERGLSSVVANDSTCSFAQTRANEIVNNFSHIGFQNRLSNHMLPYSNYALVTENIAETGDYTKVVELWANSPGHAKNMQADTPYVCVRYSGDFYAYEGWKPL